MNNGIFIDKWFHLYENDRAFKAHLDSGVISPDSICFLKETMQIYTHGSFYGINKYDFDKLVCIVEKHGEMLDNIMGNKGPSVGDGILNNLKDFEEFLSGFKEGDNLKDILDVMTKNLQDSIDAVLKHCNDCCDALRTNIENVRRNLQEQLDALESRVDLNASDISDLRNKHQDLLTEFNKHIQAWEAFKASYDSFYTYVNNRFSSMDDLMHSFQERLTTVHQDIENVKNTVNEINTVVKRCEQLIQEAQIMIQNIELKFDSLSNTVYEFINNQGHPGGSAPLDESGKIPSEYLPSYVDDVLEFPSLSLFPNPGESGKIYVTLDTNLTYRWSGTQYTEISKSLALGETSDTAYSGDKGKKVAESINTHKQDYDNPHKVTAGQVGAYTKQETDSFITNIDSRVTNVDNTVTNLNNTVNNLEQKVTNIDSNIENVVKNEISNITIEQLGVEAISESRLNEILV